MIKYFVNTKEIEGKKFYYVDFGYEDHEGISFRLWISPKLIKIDGNNREYVEFPIATKLQVVLTKIRS